MGFHLAASLIPSQNPQKLIWQNSVQSNLLGEVVFCSEGKVDCTETYNDFSSHRTVAVLLC